MDYFQFKHFKVKNIASAMKLGTDSVLLGAWAPLHPMVCRVLDIGTGTGVVALMIAQRLCPQGNMTVDAIDIDAPSIEEASHNFEISPWSSALRAMCVSLQEYAARHSIAPAGEKYDLIVSNPPFFVDSLKAPDSRRSNTRHADSLPQEDLISSAFMLLREGGSLVVILPKEEGEQFIRKAELHNIGSGDDNRLRLSKICKVKTSPRKEPKRYLMEFIMVHKSAVCGPMEETFISMTGDENYHNLMRDFLLTIS